MTAARAFPRARAVLLRSLRRVASGLGHKLSRTQSCAARESTGVEENNTSRAVASALSNVKPLIRWMVW